MIRKKENDERRRFIRHPMCFPLKYRVIKATLRKSPKEERSTTSDINRGGLLFSAQQSVKIGTLINIKIPFQSKIFSVKAKVVHCKKIPDMDLYNVGVSFMRVSEAFKIKLIEQMYLISEYRDLKSVRLGKEISLQEASQEWIKRYSKKFEKLYW